MHSHSLGSASDPGAIVVADDEPEVRSIISEYLRLHGYSVLEAANGLEVLVHVRYARPAAVILDLKMPRLGGLEALRRIHAFDPAIRVLVVTAMAEELGAEALEAGAEVVLPKPLALGELLQALRGGSVTATEPSAVAPPLPPPPTARASGLRGNVLVVDDEPELRAVLTELLQAQGHTVRAVGDAAAATGAIGRAAPDIVLLDINLPGLSGVDALPVIRRIAPETKVIMVSGSNDAEAAGRALAYGAFDYVVKPVDFAHLNEIIETALLLKARGV